MVCGCTGVAHVKLTGAKDSSEWNTAGASAYPPMLCESVAQLVGASAVAHGNLGVAPAPQVKKAPEGLPSADRGVNEGARAAARQKVDFRVGTQTI